MKKFKGIERRRTIRTTLPSQSKILGRLLFVLLFPMMFILLRVIGDNSVRLWVSYSIASLAFAFFFFVTAKRKNPAEITGLFLIFPLFFSACICIGNTSYFGAKAGVSLFMPQISPMEMLPLGTDYEGRDIYSTIIVGGMHAYLTAMVATITAFIAGIPAGIFLTSKNRILKSVFSTITQFFEIVPQLFLVLIILGIFNIWASASAATRLVWYYAVPLAGFSIGISSIPSIARIVENRVNQLKRARFVTALECSGVSPVKILLFNILWNNCMADIVINLTFLFGSTLLLDSALGYAFEIGFGDLGSGGYLTWGKIMAEGRRAILFAENYWIIAAPMFATIMSILGVNILGDCIAKNMKSRV